uniref:BHLH domain-containing protein n=1 Tax=Kalanchoe fedtschenkoi TaxID=63787 RepID=A0A7N0UDB7_KALFE
MEISEEDFLQELLALRRSSQTSSWDSTTSTPTFSTHMTHNNNVVPNANNFITTTNNTVWSNNNSSFQITSSSSSPWDPPMDPQTFSTNHPPPFDQAFHNPTPRFPSSQHHHPQLCSSAEHHPHMMEEDETASLFLVQHDGGGLYYNPFSGFEDHHYHQADLASSLLDEDQSAMMMMMMMQSDTQSLKIEPSAAATPSSDLLAVPSHVFNVGCGGSDFSERKSGGGGGKASKKVQGQPSKNLLAERRRRKRLNDRLSLLRSIVPKISKMDRTSILGDTIEYMKELLERIQSLQDELDLDHHSDDQVFLVDLFQDLKPNEVQIRNTPKFEVERRNPKDTRVEICCSGKPGLLLSTVNTMEALGLEIEQCVISCFNDFAMHASCSEDVDTGNETDCEEIKQALFRNAGYGGQCL